MSLTRPKRKAAGNKNYLDAIPETVIEEVVVKTTPNSRANPRKKAPSNGASKLASPSVAASKNHQLGKVPYNWQPPVTVADYFSNKLDLTDAYVDTTTQTLTCPNQTPEPNFSTEEEELKQLGELIFRVTATRPDAKPRKKLRVPVFQLRKGDFIYMVSEPPGEPYYVGRIMGFKRKVKLEEVETEIDDATNFVFEIQWFYRPRDISKHTSDSRLLFASMHSDTCPLSSFRGVAVVKHRLDVDTYYTPPPNQTKYTTALEFYSSFPNCFYFDKLFDRYMIKFYDIIKTSNLLAYVDNAANNIQHYLLALNKRFEFIFMEASRTKQFINNFHSTSSCHCDICAEWCASSDSVSCGGCSKHFHMLCLDPPLLKKPSRGFSWSCAACTKKHELEYRSKKILMLSHDNRTTNELELLEISELLSPKVEEEEEVESSPERKSQDTILPKFERAAIEFLRNDAEVSVEKRRLSEEWSLRYLGINTRLEDAVDLDDRSPYPRATTSLGAKYQALNIPEYEDHPIVYYDPVSNKDVSNKGKKGPGGRKVVKKNALDEEVKKLPIPKEYEDVPTKEFPQWLQPRPKGYIERGVDDGTGETCTLIWKSSDEDKADNFQNLDAYIQSCSPIADRLGMFPNSPNFMDAIVKFYMECNGDTTDALALANGLTREILKEPTFNKEEIKRFEAGVKKNGSELFPTYKEVKTQPCSMVVRYYYLWKKTKRGRQIWGNFPGRKRKSQAKDGKSEMKILSSVDEFADSDDDSAYENDKIIKHNKLFRCKHCKSYQSQYWFKITGFDGTTKYDDSTLADDIDPQTVTALCCRCAKLWRRYAVYWEDPSEVERKNARGIGGYKKKVESELAADAERILKFAELEGGSLNYEVNKKDVVSSVISISKNVELASNGTASLPAAAPAPAKRKMANRFSPKAVKAAASRMAAHASKEPLQPVRLTSRQLSITTKEAEKAEAKSEELAKLEAPKNGTSNGANGTSRKRKLAENGSTKVKEEKQDKSQPEPKKAKASSTRAPAKSAKATKAAASSTSASSAKRKRKPAADTDKKKQSPKIAESAPAKAPVVKRQKRGVQELTFLSSILNPNYRSELPRIATITKIDKRLFPNWNSTVLEDIVRNFKLRQLTDLKLIAIALPNPPNTKIDLPFHPYERNCCVCLEHDDRTESIQEMLLCANCGVNVHASCVGVSLLGKQRPIKQWLCEACINDMSPNFSNNYSCCVCLAKEQHHEMAILGSPEARPDYLLPVVETGKWCHLICALFAHNDVDFRSFSIPSFVSKEIVTANNTKPMTAVIESVSKVFIQNSECQCGICNFTSGAMIQCGLCEDSNCKYHITCAQDTPNFKLGFKLIPQKASRTIGNAFVGDKLGKLEPILVCPKHDQPDSVYGLRSMGRRTQNGEPKPLIQLFIDDVAKLSGSNLSGPQLRAHNYASLIDKYMAQQSQLSKTASSNLKENEKLIKKSCEVCSVTSSPKWWSVEGSEKVRCQNCFRLEDATKEELSEDEGDALQRELNEPLNGEHYGIKDPFDLISNVYTPSDKRELVMERSQISLSDILS